MDRELLALQTVHHGMSSRSKMFEGVMLIPSDLSVLGSVRSHLEKVCKHAGLMNEQVSELILIGDELVSNSLLEAQKQKSEEDVVLYYKAMNDCFCINVMDFCGGFIPPLFQKKPPEKDVQEYIGEALLYQTYNTVENITEEKTTLFRRLGKGLQLVRAFATSCKIFFYTVTGDITEEKDCDTQGSIIKVLYSL